MQLFAVREYAFSLALLAASAIGVCAWNTQAQSKEKGATVGFVAEFSGNISLIGEAGMQSAQLAVDEVNAAGGVLGGKLELKVGDDASDPGTALQVWEKLAAEKVDAFIFRETSAARVAVLPVAEKANIPAIYANAYEGGDCRPVLYTAGEIEPQKVAPYLKFLKSKGASKIFIVGSDINWGRIVADMVKKAAPELGFTILGEEFTPYNTTDYSPVITKIRNSGADVLISALGGTPDNVAFFKQARSSGLMQSLKVVGNLALDDTTLQAVGSAAKGSYMVASYFTSDSSQANQKYLSALKAKFGNDMKVPGIYSEPAYDSVHLYALAVNKAGTTETSAVLKALSEVVFEGSPKGAIRLTPDRHAAMPIYIAQATQEGTYKVVESLGVQQPPKQCDPQPSFGMPKK
ncbi:substrate-binding protein [Mesorhizobium sp. VK23B]|uniref:Substrate-binding protein n=1 Tax=Mesorhizobium dulcispinae TaxID=3072316 RepID=A0ABU4XQZ6_9HYPH|nr:MULTISPECIES: substrate-binding protein [unclassified Mesorhizobium]MDX8469723.1 substrate-binding protein [Mesorhizobium sp. VK23B]MDX8476062.1 substrate-binding protein [Mesorhizobium sp. VK23A]